MLILQLILMLILMLLPIKFMSQNLYDDEESVLLLVVLLVSVVVLLRLVLRLRVCLFWRILISPSVATDSSLSSFRPPVLCSNEQVLLSEAIKDCMMSDSLALEHVLLWNWFRNILSLLKSKSSVGANSPCSSGPAHSAFAVTNIRTTITAAMCFMLRQL